MKRVHSDDRWAVTMASDGEARQVVVVGVDGSDPSIAALNWAGHYGAATGAVVWALHIWHYPTSAALPPGVAPPQVSDEVKAHQRKELDDAIAKPTWTRPPRSSPGSRTGTRRRC